MMKIFAIDMNIMHFFIVSNTPPNINTCHCNGLSTFNGPMTKINDMGFFLIPQSECRLKSLNIYRG